MDKRIELELRGRERSEVTELNLDNCRTTTIIGLTDEFKKLQNLSMINVGLTSLKGLPTLESLSHLDLSENRISTGLEALTSCPNLKYINLSGNRIAEWAAVEPLKKLEQLKSLDLFGNEIAVDMEYRRQIFEMMPNLTYLDGYDKNEDAETDDEVVENEEEYETSSGEEEEIGEEEDSEEDEDEDEAEGEECGLEYLQSSTVMQDEDETEDYKADESGEEKKAEEGGEPRGTKRKHEGEGDGDVKTTQKAKRQE